MALNNSRRNFTEVIMRNILKALYIKSTDLGDLGGVTKEDIGIEQQLYEILRGKNFALNCLS